jgi:ketosteroid isomerase-like protein
MKSRPIAIVGISYVLISTALAADSPEKATSPETTAITNQAAEYAKAYNAADAKALAQYFTDDAEYTDENGQLTQGRSDIEQLLTDKNNLIRKRYAKDSRE